MLNIIEVLLYRTSGSHNKWCEDVSQVSNSAMPLTMYEKVLESARLGSV